MIKGKRSWPSLPRCKYIGELLGEFRIKQGSCGVRQHSAHLSSSSSSTRTISFLPPATDRSGGGGGGAEKCDKRQPPTHSPRIPPPTLTTAGGGNKKKKRLGGRGRSMAGKQSRTTNGASLLFLLGGTGEGATAWN